ncbi:MAG: ABC transporter permease [Acidobacteria bacterium]|nr:ABC transporter permease [Acidobacteriota bacterium]
MKKSGKDLLRSFTGAVLALFFAFLISSIIIVISGKDPILAGKALIAGSIGSGDSILLTLQKTIPLIFTGLSVAIGFKAGLFNIGAEGQMYIGAIISAWLAAQINIGSGFLLIPLVFILSILGGAIWGLVPGLLRSYRGVHEVLSTIMMNYIAIHFTLFFVKGPMRGDPHIVKSKPIQSAAELPNIIHSGALTLSIGIIIAIFSAVLLWFFLKKTTAGYLLRMTGQNKTAVDSAGFNSKKIIVFTMMLAGGLAGLGGAVEITGLHHTFYGQFSPGYGFDGIAVALIASNNPIGVIFAALLFGALRAADRHLQLSADVPKDLILIIQGLVILFIGIRYFLEKKGDFLFRHRKKTESE